MNKATERAFLVLRDIANLYEYQALLDAIDDIRGAFEDLEVLVREANLEATDSDGMFPRNPHL